MADIERGSPIGAEQARTLTAQLQAAIADVRQAGMVLAGRVRRAHQERVWTALGYASWAEYATTELGVSRAQAYRLVDMATTADQLTAVVTDLQLSPAGDTELSGRALRDVHGRVAEVAAVLTDRVAELRAAGQELTQPQAATLIAEAVADVRHRPALPPPPAPSAAQPATPPVETGRKLVEHLYAEAARLGALALEIAPAYWSDAEAAVPLAVFADDIGAELDEVMAQRRYAITGDRRTLPFHPTPSADLKGCQAGNPGRI